MIHVADHDLSSPGPEMNTLIDCMDVATDIILNIQSGPIDIQFWTLRNDDNCNTHMVLSSLGADFL